MIVSPRRILSGAIFIASLIAVAALLRIGLEWRQVIADVNAMIVTPATLPTEPVVTPTPQPAVAEEVFGPPRRLSLGNRLHLRHQTLHRQPLQLPRLFSLADQN